MFNVEWFDKISIKKVGNCMLGRFLHSLIQVYLKKTRWLVINKELKQKENKLSESLKLLKLWIFIKKKVLIIFYDDDYYDSIEEKIDNMIENGKFGGNLKLYIMSKIYKIK